MKCMMMLKASAENQRMRAVLSEEISWHKCGLQWGLSTR
jgi:hypothetical protein